MGIMGDNLIRLVFFSNRLSSLLIAIFLFLYHMQHVEEIIVSYDTNIQIVYTLSILETVEFSTYVL